MQVRSEHRQRSLPPIRYLLVLWLFVLSAVAFLDRTNISIAGVHISREFAIDNTHLGWVFSAFLIGYAIFQIPAGILAKRFGPRRVLSFGIEQLIDNIERGTFADEVVLRRRRAASKPGAAVGAPN